MDDEKISLLTLSLICEIGPRRMGNLINRFGSATKALNASKEELCSVEGINPALASKIYGAKNTVDTVAELELAGKLGVEIITYDEKNYPENLKNLNDWPYVLYVRGNLKKDDALSVAIVGTRHPTNYGKSAAVKFARELSGFGVTTVSGLARGIDTEVHRASIDCGKRTIAFLGNGLNRHYPPENRKLEDKIAQNGALISEFPLNTTPDASNFPRRNRLISGFSLATVVIEAGMKSGALITARYATEQGKDVFAVPGPIFSKYSKGTHFLIKSGAHLLEEAGEIVEELKPLFEWVKEKKQTAKPAESAEVLGSQSQKVVKFIEQYLDGISIDAILSGVDIPFQNLSQSLLELELKGFIKSLPGKVYIKNQ